MYTLLHDLSFKKVIFEQMPTIMSSMVVAEVFYKFHSFTLECIAFLATWYAFDRFRVFFFKKIKVNIKEKT